MKYGTGHKVLPLIETACKLAYDLANEVEKLDIDKNAKALIRSLANNITAELDKVIFIDIKQEIKGGGYANTDRNAVERVAQKG